MSDTGTSEVEGTEPVGDGFADLEGAEGDLDGALVDGVSDGVGDGVTDAVGESASDLLADGADDEIVTEDDLVEDEIERRSTRARRGASRPGPFRRLYRGETSFDFVGRRRWWILVSSVIILAGIVSLGVRGLNLGITFKGGEAWTVSAPGITQTAAFNAVQAAGLNQPTVEVLGSGSAETIRVTADLNNLSAAQKTAETAKVIGALAKLTHHTKTAVSVTTVGPTWGGQVTEKAVIALIVFLVLVAAYISLRFEPKMALAAFIALLHDLLVTAGVYSLAGFQVTPDTVIAILTILGYSLYDTVVVFDRVRDNSRGLGASGRMTYTDMVNLSMNQTLARSINTSLVAILPVLSVLVIGAELLGATTLLNYGLALFVGLLSGAYSSIFIASPILAWLKEHEPRYVAVRQRVESRGERLGLLTPRAAAALLGASASGGAERLAARAARQRTTLRPGQARVRSQGSPRAAAGAMVGPETPEGPVAGQRAGGSNAANGARASGQRSAAPRPRPAARRPAQRPRKGGKGKRRR